LLKKLLIEEIKILKNSFARNKRFIGFVWIFIIIAASSGAAFGATYTVTKTADTNDNVCDADCSLREALGSAAATSADDVINFDPYVFSTPQTILFPGGGATLSTSGKLTINGPGADLLTISANNVGRVMSIAGGNATINNVKITGGNASDAAGGVGGGINLSGGASVLNLSNSIVTGNTASIVGGGIASNGTVNINNSSISNNTVTGNNSGGGGIFSQGNLTISNSTISANISNTGGGGLELTVGQTGGSPVSPVRTITNSTISGNNARFLGGGLAFGFGTLNLVNATIAGNTTEEGGGIHHFNINSGSTINVQNSIIADNIASARAPDVRGTLQSQGYNLIEDTTDTIIQGITTGNILGQDPKLSALANNGGSTPTKALQAGSPAIDAADPNNFPPTDQRGYVRPADGDGNGSSLPDIGAYERNAFAPYRPAFDFDGDGKSDVSVFRPSSGTWFTSTNPATNFGAIQFGAADDTLVPADYDGDGKTDVAVFRPSNGTWYIQRSQLGFTFITFGAGSDVPVPADYDADGKADIAVFRPSTGTWFTSINPATNFGSIQFGAAGDKPVPADYDADGKADLAVFRPSNGVWYLLQSSLGFTGIAFGDGADKLVPADYDADGKADIAVFRPSNGVWYLQQSTNGFTGIAFGFGTDLPVPADYDSDGKTDLSVFRESNGVWYQQRTTQGFTGIAFGAAGDKPAPNAFVR